MTPESVPLLRHRGHTESHYSRLYFHGHVESVMNGFFNGPGFDTVADDMDIRR